MLPFYGGTWISFAVYLVGGGVHIMGYMGYIQYGPLLS